MSNLPLGIVSSLGGIHTDRLHRLSSHREDSIQEKTSRIKKAKVNREDNKTLGYTNSPSCNFSFATVSGQSRNKLALSGALKGLEKMNYSQLSEISLSQNLQKPSTAAKKATGLNISTSLIDKIKKRHQDRSSQALSPKGLESKAAATSDNSKFVNIALSNAKNVNMFEINNYYATPLNEENTLSVASQSAASKRVENKVLELAKQKAAKKLEAKQQTVKSARQKPPASHIVSLQTKLTSIAASLKNK